MVMEVPKFAGTTLTFTTIDRFGACYLEELHLHDVTRVLHHCVCCYKYTPRGLR